MALSQQERDRLKEIHGVLRGQLRIREAAERLGLSQRQVKRVLRRVRSARRRILLRNEF